MNIPKIRAGTQYAGIDFDGDEDPYDGHAPLYVAALKEANRRAAGAGGLKKFVMTSYAGSVMNLEIEARRNIKTVAAELAKIVAIVRNESRKICCLCGIVDPSIRLSHGFDTRVPLPTYEEDEHAEAVVDRTQGIFAST